MQFKVGQEVLYEPNIETIKAYDLVSHGGLVGLAGKVGVVVQLGLYGGLIGVDFGFHIYRLHSLGILPKQTGLWVTPKLLYPAKINIKSYEEMM